MGTGVYSPELPTQLCPTHLPPTQGQGCAGFLGTPMGTQVWLFSRRHLRDTGGALVSAGVEQVWACAGKVRELRLISFNPVTGSCLLSTYYVYLTCIVPGTRCNYPHYGDGKQKSREVSCVCLHSQKAQRWNLNPGPPDLGALLLTAMLCWLQGEVLSQSCNPPNDSVNQCYSPLFDPC